MIKSIEGPIQLQGLLNHGGPAHDFAKILPKPLATAGDSATRGEGGAGEAMGREAGMGDLGFEGLCNPMRSEGLCNHMSPSLHALQGCQTLAMPA